MKVLFVVEATSAGVGRHVMDLAEGLLERGHHVHLLFSPARQDARFRERVDKLSERGLSAVSLLMDHKPSPRDLSGIAAVRRYAKNRGPFDLVHCHSTKAGLIGRIAMVGRGVRTVYTPHAFLTMNTRTSIPVRWLAGRLERALGELGDSIIAVSETEAAHARKLGIRPERIFLVPNGIGPRDRMSAGLADRPALRVAAGLEPREVCVGFLGRLCPQKAPDLLLRAFSLVNRRVGPIRLVIAGSGPLADELHCLADRLGLARQIRWLGSVNANEALPLFDIFALSSAYEGMPYVLLEAMTYGLPVIATDVGGVNSLIRDGNNGYIVPPGDVSMFADRLATLISCPEMRDRMGCESRRVAQQFTSDRMVNDTLRVYEAVIRAPAMQIVAGTTP